MQACKLPGDIPACEDAYPLVGEVEALPQGSPQAGTVRLGHGFRAGHVAWHRVGSRQDPAIWKPYDVIEDAAERAFERAHLALRQMDVPQARWKRCLRPRPGWSFPGMCGIGGGFDAKFQFLIDPAQDAEFEFLVDPA